MICDSCKQPKGVHSCGICRISLCKKCTQRLAENAFPYLSQVPEELTHRDYCGPCFSRAVYPAQLAYQREVAAARQVFIFTKAKSEETRLMGRSEKPLRVTDCADQDETLMRLAFQAVRAGYNALIDVDVSARKVRNFGYQNSLWQGSGIPTRVDRERLERESR